MATVTALTASDQTVVTAGGGHGYYYGFVLCETGGSTAHVRIYDNTANSGTLLDSIKLVAGESVAGWYGPQGLQYKIGIRVDVVSGTVEGSVRHG